MTRLRAQDAAARAARGTSADYSEALHRGLQVMLAFDSTRPQMSLSEIASFVNLPRATVRRALNTLYSMGFVAVSGRNFRLQPAVLRFASSYLTTNGISTVVQPLCDRLAAELDESCTAAVLDGTDATMVARAAPRRPGQIALGAGVGYRVPAAASALGRVLLAALDEASLTAHLALYPAGSATPATSQDPEVLRRLLHQVAEQGYAYVDQEVELGFHSIAVPLRRFDGTVVAALNIGTSVEKTPFAVLLDKMLPRLYRSAVEASGLLI